MDKQEETNRKYYEYLNSEPWKIKARQRMEIDDFVCQGCGARGSALNPLNTHHMTYHNIYNEDVYHDLVVVCRSCHCIITNVMNRKTSPDGKRGFKENPNTPTVNTFVLSGLDLQVREENLNDAKEGNSKNAG